MKSKVLCAFHLDIFSHSHVLNKQLMMGGGLASWVQGGLISPPGYRPDMAKC